MDEIRQAFEKYDTDKSGSISTEEAHNVLKTELGFTEASSQRLLKIYDRNSDGKLSYEEFIWFYWKVQEKKKDVEAMFQRFDQDHNNTVSAEEAKTTLMDLGFTSDDIEHLVALHDVNGDGVLQYEEFVRFWHTITQ